MTECHPSAEYAAGSYAILTLFRVVDIIRIKRIFHERPHARMALAARHPSAGAGCNRGPTDFSE